MRGGGLLLELADVQDQTPIDAVPYTVAGSRLRALVVGRGGLRLLAADGTVDADATERALAWLDDLPMNRSTALQLAEWLVREYPA